MNRSFLTLTLGLVIAAAAPSLIACGPIDPEPPPDPGATPVDPEPPNPHVDFVDPEPPDLQRDPRLLRGHDLAFVDPVPPNPHRGRSTP